MKKKKTLKKGRTFERVKVKKKKRKVKLKNKIQPTKNNEQKNK